MILSIMANKPTIKNALKWVFSGVCIFFVGMLVIMIVHDTMTGTSSKTEQYCAKYRFLASPGCW